MKLPWLKVIGVFFLAVTLLAPAWGTDAYSALPGTLNYIEGQAFIGTQPLDPSSAVGTVLKAGQTLTTEKGKAEMLLTPGVFFRLGDNSSATVVSPTLTNTRIDLRQGEAMVEVADIHPENNLLVTADGATARLRKTGLYDFDAVHDQVRVFKGKGLVREGDREVTVKGGHEVALNTAGKLKSHKFNKDDYKQADLYRWSKLRSSYLAEANVNAARIYMTNG